jgi:hypothetical protein
MVGPDVQTIQSRPALLTNAATIAPKAQAVWRRGERMSSVATAALLNGIKIGRIASRVMNGIVH